MTETLFLEMDSRSGYEERRQRESVKIYEGGFEELEFRYSSRKPVWEHECDECTYLGSIYVPNENTRDLYHCTIGYRGTVISRHGDDCHAYISGLAIAETGHYPTLTIAMNLAVKKGLIKEQDND